MFQGSCGSCSDSFAYQAEGTTQIQIMHLYPMEGHDVLAADSNQQTVVALPEQGYQQKLAEFQ